MMDEPFPMDEPRPGQWLLVVAFLAAIAAPGALGLLAPRANAVAIRNERRRPAPLPPRPLDRASLEDYPSAFDEWFDDHFGLRTTLIRWHGLLKVRLFRATPSDRVTLGSDDWMFVGKRDYTHTFRATKPFSSTELEDWAATVRFKHDWCAERGIRYLFAIAPNKSTIYPERMPTRYSRVGEQTRHDQLYAYLRSETRIEVLDLRPALLEAKSEGLLYYPLGSHWNDLGAHHAATAIAERLRTRWFPSLGHDSLENYDVEVHRGAGPDSWASRLHVADHFPQEWTTLARRVPPYFEPVALGSDEGTTLSFEQQGGSLPRAALLRDSFGTALAPQLAPFFSRIACFWQWRREPYEIPALLENERPDVVIDLVVEQLLMSKESHTRWEGR